jgi:hypothetical protein
MKHNGCKHTLSQWLMVSNEAEWLQTHPQPMVKGTVSRDFRSSVFFIKQYPWGSDSKGEAFFHSVSNSPRHDRFSDAKIVHAVSLKIFC